MQVTLGKRGDYAVRAMLDLSHHHDGTRRKAREIAAAMNIPPAFLPQILADLVHAGLLTAVAGQRGGYALTRAPETISLLDVVEAAEGTAGIPSCVLRDVPCGTNGHCEVHNAWSAALDELRSALDHTTFAALVHEARAPGPARTRGAAQRRQRPG